MNSYNENLYSAVFASMATLERDEQKERSELDAAMFTLYYAQGARITAFDNLEEATERYCFQQDVKEQAVNSNNISVNVTNTASQQKEYTAQSVSNAAVGASNIQIAANAIVRLASNIGSINSVIKAADFETELSQQADLVYNLLTEVAMDAEAVSQRAMNASAATAEVSSASVADQARTTNVSVGNLFKAVSSDFDTIAAVMASSNDKLASASIAEKVAEGLLEISNADYYATATAIRHSNQQLNLDITVSVFNATQIDSVKGENGAYEITFNYYKSPFPGDPGKDEIKRPYYPVQDYYVILVKNNKKATFSINYAETLAGSGRAVKVENIPAVTGDTKAHVKIKRLDLKDSDDEVMEFGKSYVVFVLAIFTDDYKKALNAFDNYLTVPSAVFKLTSQVASPKGGTIKTDAENKSKLVFRLPQNYFPCQYRCIFLQCGTSLIQGFLANRGLQYIEQQIEQLEEGPVTVKHAESVIAANPGIFFNVQIAEQVSRANYIIAEVKNGKCSLLIDGTTTDNFGNPLIEEKSYTPVILTVADVSQKDLEKYTSSISDYENTAPYIHNRISKTDS